MNCYYQNENGKLYNADFVEIAETLPEKSQQLIIADPPYFQVKGEFDFIWKDFDEYLKDVEKWAVACKRILADNGTLFWWGDKRRIAYCQIILDKYFNLENSLIWQKTDSMQYQYYSPDLARTFNTHNERILMYSNEIGQTGLEMITEEFIKPRNPFSKYLKEEFSRANISNKEIAKLFPSKTGGLTGCVSNWLNGDNVITKEQYIKIKDFLGLGYLRKEYEDLRKEYEDLRKEYEQKRRYFYNPNKYEEVLKFSQESNISGKHDHETIKSETLTQALILTCSRKGDNVFIPFVGSGTECVVSEREHRKWTGCEIKTEYCKMAADRIKKAREQFLFAFL